MKWIAHRGASLEMPENTLASLRLGSALGAYAVECDVRRLADGEYVIYHDGTLAPLTGGTDTRAVESLTTPAFSEILRTHGRRLTRFSDVLSQYRSRAAVLLHIYLAPDALTDDMLRTMAAAPFRFICGIRERTMQRDAVVISRLRRFLPSWTTKTPIATALPPVPGTFACGKTGSRRSHRI